MKSTGGGLDDGRVGRADCWGCGSGVWWISGETEVVLVMDGEPSLAAGTTRFRRLITDFFIATGLCEPCSL